MKQTFFLFALAVSPCFKGQLQAQSAMKRILQSADYKVEVNTTISSHQSPLWLNANRYGLSSVKGDNAYLRLGMEHNEEQDSTHHWHLGYGIDVALAKNFTSEFIVHQFYATLDYKKVRLTIGSKEFSAALSNSLLASGNQTFGINARPIPQMRIETTDYIRLLKNKDWIKFKGHFGYGFFTDATFQKHHNTESHYAEGACFHTKAGYLRLGDEKKFPLTFDCGLEMASIFGGTIYDTKTGEGIKMSSGISAAFKAIYGGGSDPTDGAYNNVSGDMLGSWLFGVNYYGKGWKLRAYLDHFFEDHSQLFLQYGWKDGLIGFEFTPPQNRIFDGFVYEYITTRDQSGPMLHNTTAALPYQISGGDGYYNHGLYAGWQHWGQAIGNPLFYSPLYKNDGRFVFDNRFCGHHFGVSGNPMVGLSYRLLFSHTKCWGTYEDFYSDPKCKNSLLAEIAYSVKNQKSKLFGWSARIGFAHDGGNQHGHSTGVSLTISKKGKLF